MKYSKVMDRMILATLSLRQGNHEEAALHLQEAAEDPNYDEEIAHLYAMNDFEEASIFDNSELAEMSEEEEEEEVSDEESLAKALASLSSGRKGRKMGRRSEIAADEEDDDDDFIADEEEEETAAPEMSEEESSEEDGDSEVEARLKRRLAKQKKNLDNL